MSTLRTQFQQLLYEYRSIVASEPRLAPLYRPVVWWEQYKNWRYYRERGVGAEACDVTPRTELVLDGFQGSANGFAVGAFNRMQSRPVRMAHHMHAPVQIIKGVRLGLPTLVTIRPPVGAVSSLASRWPYVSLPQGLRGYVRFYEALQPYRDGFVLSPFEQTVGHFGDVVRRLNRQFGTDFGAVAPDEERGKQGQDDDGLKGPAGSTRGEARKRLKREKKRELEGYKGSAMMARAEAIHQRLVEKVEQQ